MQYKITLDITATSDMEAYKMAKYFMSSPAVAKVTVEDEDGKALVSKTQKTKPVEITAKIFAPDKNSSIWLGYTKDGIYNEIESVGDHKGQDVMLTCDAGTNIYIGCDDTTPARFTTDGTFGTRLDVLSDRIDVYCSGNESKGFLMLDSHLGKDKRIENDLMIASGALKGATVTPQAVVSSVKEAV
jgi:hypothetical protein